MRLKKNLYGRWYLCGPMTGIKSFNIPLFDEAAANLRAHGFEVVSPAELDDPATRVAALASKDGKPGEGSANGETWGDFLSRDVKLLADGKFTGIVLLPTWTASRGALLETLVAFLHGLAFREYDMLDGVSCSVSKYYVYGQWITGLWRKITL